MSELQHANAGLSGFGTHSAAEVEQLQKALGLGGQGGVTDGTNGTGGPILGAGDSYTNQFPSQFTGGNALAVEDLDRTLKLVTFGLEHLRLWKDILKERVPQVVHEYNIQNAYGLSDASPFFEMGATPVETDASYNRDVVQIKYLGTKGAVLHNLTLIQAAHGPVVAREVKNKTIELLARNERAMFDANSLIESREYDGLEAQIIAKGQNAVYQSSAFASYGNSGSGSIIIDAAGADFDEDIAEDSALTAVNNFGMPMDMYLGTDVHSAFSRAFYAKQRTVPGESLTSGNRVTEHMGTLDYRFKPSLFNRPRLTPSVALGSQAATFVLGAGGSAAFDTLFIAVGLDGREINTDFEQGTNNLSVTISGITSAEQASRLYINMYVRPNGGDFASYRFCKRVPYANTTAAIFVNNEVFAFGGNSMAPNINASAASINRISGTAKAYLLMHDPDVLCWKQLGSMIKYDLAVTTTQYEWLQLLYGTPLVMAPLKNVIVTNLKSEA